MPDDRPIGVFDSGIGGLTLVHALGRALPNERIIFFGDTAHLPYGDKSAKNIQAFAQEILHFFFQQNCKAVLIACNTASAIAYPKLMKYWASHLLLFNVIDPVVRTCIQSYKPHKVGVIGTRSTIQSRSYPRKFNQLDKTIAVTTASTPLLAPMIEEGFYNNKISRTIISAYLSKKQFENIEALILGCTHYPLIRKEVESFYRGSTPVLDNIDPTITELSNTLSNKDMLNNGFKSSDSPDEQNLNTFFVSDYTQSFEETAKQFFGKALSLQKYDIWGYDQS
jgi:glutamate racemase